jgi:ferritin
MSKVSQKLGEAFNDQVQKELASAYLYLSMSAHCESVNFKGAASWLRIQWQEEIGHAMKLMGHLGDRGNRVVLRAIEQPRGEFGSLLEVFEAVLDHERQVSAAINRLYGLAVDEKDFASQAFLQWYVSEQVEEEATVGQIVDHLRAVGDQGGGIWYLDSRMGKRGKD